MFVRRAERIKAHLCVQMCFYVSFVHQSTGVYRLAALGGLP